MDGELIEQFAELYAKEGKTSDLLDGQSAHAHRQAAGPLYTMVAYAAASEMSTVRTASMS